MWLSSLPLLGLFCMGIYSCILVIRVDEELDMRKEADKERIDRLDREAYSRPPESQPIIIDNANADTELSSERNLNQQSQR